MKGVWIGLITEIFIYSIIKPFIVNSEIASICFIGINFLIFIICIVNYKKGFRELFYSAYSIRLLAMFWDVYFRHIYILPHSGKDSEGFLHSAFMVANDISLLKANIYGDMYSKFLGILFYLTSFERLIGQYINVLLGITIVVIVYKILCLLAVNEKTVIKVVALASFFPHGIIFSAILLRENLISFFVILSFFYFARWYKGNSVVNIIMSLLSIAAASLFHSGIIGVLSGYGFMYMFYKPDKNKLFFSKKSIMYFIIFVIIFFLLFNQLSHMFLGKFDKIQGANDIINTANSRLGGGAYLTHLKTESTWQLFLFSPIMMFYFLTSPLPLDWRGLNDVISFVLDGFIYFILMGYCIANTKKCINKNPILFSLLIILFFVIFTFGIGVHNSGTALRHRHKIFYLILVFFGLTIDYKKTNNYRASK